MLPKADIKGGRVVGTPIHITAADFSNNRQRALMEATAATTEAATPITPATAVQRPPPQLLHEEVGEESSALVPAAHRRYPTTLTINGVSFQPHLEECQWTPKNMTYVLCDGATRLDPPHGTDGSSKEALVGFLVPYSALDPNASAAGMTDSFVEFTCSVLGVSILPRRTLPVIPN